MSFMREESTIPRKAFRTFELYGQKKKKPSRNIDPEMIVRLRKQKKEM